MLRGVVYGVRRLVTQHPTLANRKGVDRSRVPQLAEDDLKVQFVRGGGPGGQATNKTSNCVVLTHTPTGVVIKCHKTRSQGENHKIARELLITKLDNLVNGELSVENQIKAMEKKRILRKEQKRKKLAELKEQWKKNEGLT